MHIRIASALIVLFLLVACGRSNLDKLNGVWKCDGNATIALHPDMAGMGPLGEKMFDGISMSFDIPGKKVIMRFGAQANAKNLVVLSDSDKTVVLGGLGHELSITFQTDDSILVHDAKDPMKTLIFIRVK